MKQKNQMTQERAALKAGMSRKTAGKYLNQGKLPSEMKKAREYKTRKDPFEEVWPKLQEMLQNAPGLEAKTLLEWLLGQAYNPPFHMGQLRSLQRKIRRWRIEKGPDKSVIFPQNIQPGRQSQSDYTCMNRLKIQIKGEDFPHLLFHFMLPYSCWETISICFSESFESLATGYSKAVWELGGVLPEHRTDNLTAATHQFGGKRKFNESWEACLAHHGAIASRNNPRESHENGSVEKSNDLFKREIEQQLLRTKSLSLSFRARIQKGGEDLTD